MPQKESTKLSNKKSSDIDKRDVPIVGIGASAGGLEAFKSLLESLPIDTGIIICCYPAPCARPRKHANGHSFKIHQNARPSSQR